MPSMRPDKHLIWVTHDITCIPRGSAIWQDNDTRRRTGTHTPIRDLHTRPDLIAVAGADDA